MPIKLFNTGVGLKEGDPDPHWQVVARSDDPNFKPRPAVVTAVGRRLPGEQSGPVAMDLAGQRRARFPNGVTCTFRTTFEIKAALPPGQGTDLAGQLNAFSYVKAMRVNGKVMPLPKDPRDPGKSHPPAGASSAGKKWVVGVNYVEFDVTNEAPSHPRDTSPILLRVAWH